VNAQYDKEAYYNKLADDVELDWGVSCNDLCPAFVWSICSALSFVIMATLLLMMLKAVHVSWLMSPNTLDRILQDVM